MDPRPHSLALPAEAGPHDTTCQDLTTCHPAASGSPAYSPPAVSSTAAAAPALSTAPRRPGPTEDIPCSPRSPVYGPTLLAATATAADSATAQGTSELALGANSPPSTPAMSTTRSTSCESACGSPGSLLAHSPASTVSGTPALSPIRSPCFDSPPSSTTASPSALPKQTETLGPLHSRRALCFERALQQQEEQQEQQAPPPHAPPSQPEPSSTTALLNKLISFLPPAQPEQTAWKHTTTIAHEVSLCSGAGDLLRPGKELAAFNPQRTLQHSGGPLPRVTQAGSLPDGTTVVQKRVPFEVSQLQLLGMQVAHLGSGLRRNNASSGAASAATSSCSASSSYPHKPAVPEYVYRELKSYMAVTERLRAVDPAYLKYVVPIQRWGVLPDVEWNTSRTREARDAPLRFVLVIETELAQYGSLRQCMKLMGEAAHNRREWPCWRWLLGLAVGKAEALRALRHACVLLPDYKFENAVVDRGCRVRLIDLDGARLLPLPSGDGSCSTSSGSSSWSGSGCAVVRTADGGAMPVSLWPHPFTPDYAAPEMVSCHVAPAMAYGGTVEELLEAAQLKKDMPALGRLVEGVRSGALGPSQLQELGVEVKVAAGEQPLRCVGVPHVSPASQVHQFGESLRVAMGDLRAAVEGRLAEQGRRKPWSPPYDGCVLKPWDMRLVEELSRLADECTALLPSARPDAGQLVERLAAMLRKVEATEARERRAMSGVQQHGEVRGQRKAKSAARKEAGKGAKGAKPAWRI